MMTWYIVGTLVGMVGSAFAAMRLSARRYEREQQIIDLHRRDDDTHARIDEMQREIYDNLDKLRLSLERSYDTSSNQ